MHQGRTSPPASPERLATRLPRKARAGTVAGWGLRRGVLIVRRGSKPAELIRGKSREKFGSNSEHLKVIF